MPLLQELKFIETDADIFLICCKIIRFSSGFYCSTKLKVISVSAFDVL